MVSRNHDRSGSESRYAAVNSFWRFTQSATSSESGSSSQRYGSGTARPCSTSTTSSRRVSGNGVTLKKATEPASKAVPRLLTVNSSVVEFGLYWLYRLFMALLVDLSDIDATMINVVGG